MYYLLFFVNQDPFSIDKNQQNEYTELPTIAVIGLAGCCMLQALAYSWQEVFLDVISSEYIYICNKQGPGGRVRAKGKGSIFPNSSLLLVGSSTN